MADQRKPRSYARGLKPHIARINVGNEWRTGDCIVNYLRKESYPHLGRLGITTIAGLYHHSVHKQWCYFYQLNTAPGLYDPRAQLESVSLDPDVLNANNISIVASVNTPMFSDLVSIYQRYLDYYDNVILMTYGVTMDIDISDYVINAKVIVAPEVDARVLCGHVTAGTVFMTFREFRENVSDIAKRELSIIRDVLDAGAPPRKIRKVMQE